MGEPHALNTHHTKRGTRSVQAKSACVSTTPGAVLVTCNLGLCRSGCAEHDGNNGRPGLKKCARVRTHGEH